MRELLEDLLPNVIDKLDIFYGSIADTLLMIFRGGGIAFVIGGILGIMLVVTRKDGVSQNLAVYHILDKVINFFRSIPFIILLAGLIGVTRWIMGTAIGVKGAIVPLVFGTAPFYARQIESALSEVSPGLIEAAQAMGTGLFGIIFRVYLKESVVPIIRGTTITIISLISLTAMAGAVGAGGLGDFAIRYGYNRNQFDVTVVSITVLVGMVGIVQSLGTFTVKKITH